MRPVAFNASNPGPAPSPTAPEGETATGPANAYQRAAIAWDAAAPGVPPASKVAPSSIIAAPPAEPASDERAGGLVSWATALSAGSAAVVCGVAGASVGYLATAIAREGLTAGLATIAKYAGIGAGVGVLGVLVTVAALAWNLRRRG